MTTFPALLTAYRQRAGLNQSALAALAGLSHTTVCRFESREREPARETVAVLADALRLDDADELRFYLAAGFVPTRVARSEATMEMMVAVAQAMERTVTKERSRTVRLEKVA